MAARIVAVSTSSRIVSVALCEDGVIKQTIEREGRGHALVPMIDELLRAQSLSPRDVTRWAVGVGPGSFTGIRVGLSTVKGLAFATGAEIVGVDAFDAVEHGIVEGLRVVLLPAGKGELFVRVHGQAPDHAIASAIRDRLMGRAGLTLIGEGALTLDATALDAHVITEPPHDIPRASAIAFVAATRTPGDLDLLEPLYVRPPDLTKPREAP